MKGYRFLGGEIWFLNQILYSGRQVKRAVVNDKLRNIQAKIF